MIELVRDTYRYRELIWALALKELKIRYKRSVLGFMWALLNPALLMVVLTLVFSTIMRFNIPHYAVFLLSVLLPWTFFSQSLSYAVEAIVANGDLIKKIAVPKLVFPMAAVVSNIINLLLSLIPLALLVPLLRHPFYWTWLYLPDLDRGAQAGVSHGSGGLEHHQPAAFSYSAGLAGSTPAAPLLLDLVVLAGSTAGLGHLHPGDDILLRRRQCVLPRCGAHPADLALGVVLPDSNYLSP